MAILMDITIARQFCFAGNNKDKAAFVEININGLIYSK
jgi:hypothetical protein